MHSEGLEGLSQAIVCDGAAAVATAHCQRALNVVEHLSSEYHADSVCVAHTRHSMATLLNYSQFSGTGLLSTESCCLALLGATAVRQIAQWMLVESGPSILLLALGMRQPA